MRNSLLVFLLVLAFDGGLLLPSFFQPTGAADPPTMVVSTMSGDEEGIQTDPLPPSSSSRSEGRNVVVTEDNSNERRMISLNDSDDEDVPEDDWKDYQEINKNEIPSSPSSYTEESRKSTASSDKAPTESVDPEEPKSPASEDPSTPDELKEPLKQLNLTVLPLSERDSESIPRAIIVLHRHGARLPGSIDPETKQIQWETCELTETGMKQLHSLGQWLREIYGPLLGEKYSTDRIVSRSTNYNRTIQSGMAMLLGLYPDALAPLLRYDDTNWQWDLMPWTMPAMLLHNVKERFLRSDAAAHFRQKNLQPSETFDLAALDQFLGTGQLCQTEETIWECLMLAFDTLQYRTSERPFESPCPPEVCTPEMFEKIIEARNFVTHFTVVEFEPYFRTYVPSTGGLLAQRIIEIMEGGAKGNVVMNHFSVHDTTLVGLYQTLGLITRDKFNTSHHMPSFGEAVVIEVFDKEFRVVRASINRGMKYDAKVEEIQCARNAELSERCEIELWGTTVKKNYLSRITDQCTIPPTDFEQEGCSFGATPSLACLAYRKVCFRMGCEANTISKKYIVNLADPLLTCQKLDVGEQKDPKSFEEFQTHPSGPSPSSTTAPSPNKFQDPSSLRAALIILVIGFAIAVIGVLVLWMRPRNRDTSSLTEHLELADRGSEFSPVGRY